MILNGYIFDFDSGTEVPSASPRRLACPQGGLASEE